jgi:hypothetical protein
MLGILLGILTPAAALAQVGSLDGIVEKIAPMLPKATDIVTTFNITCISVDTACVFARLLAMLVEKSRLAVAALAILVVIVAGLRMVMSQSEETQTSAKHTLTYAATGIFVIFLVGPIVRVLYGGIMVNPGSVLSSSADVIAATTEARKQLFGVILFLETIVGIIAVVMLVIQGLRIVLSFGSQNIIQKSYKGVLAILGGMLLIALDRVLLQIFGLPETGGTAGPTTTIPLLFQIFGFVRFVLTLLAIIPIGIIIYAGLLMILNFGNEELVKKAKTSIINALIGLGIVIVSFAIVSTLILRI